MSALNLNSNYFSIRKLTKHFPIRKGVLKRKVGYVSAVDNVSFEIDSGKTLGLVGESGCGKTTIARMILHLEKPSSGEIIFEGNDTADIKGELLRKYRRTVQLIFQDPYSSLNPHRNIKQIIAEPFIIHRIITKRSEISERVSQILELVNLSSDCLKKYPHELSGGQRQRVGIARALALNPKILICDEPVSALDVSIRSQIINLLLDLQKRLNLTYLFISHDLSLVEHMSDQVAVMYLGKIVELLSAENFFDERLHPYTDALLSAVPLAKPGLKKNRIILSGDVPSPINPPSGCRFRTRCPIVEPICAENEPPFKKITTNHFVACHLRG
jgi:oligopeptide transport system ATP-binding protein